MDILFVLLGIAIFYAAAAVFAIEHYETNPAQAAVSFFIPPFAWWLYYHYWQRSEKIAYAQIVAFFLFLGGVILLTWFSDSPTKILQLDNKASTKEFDSSGYVGSDAALKDLTQAERLSSTLNGRLLGETFLFDIKNDAAEFDTQGTLRIKRGSDFFGDFEIAIELNELPPQSETPWQKTIRIDTLNPPVIYVSWYDNDEKILRSRKYTNGYHLDLSLVHEEYNLFAGKIQLVLPDPEQSYLVGNIPVFTSRLRFHGEGINKEYDSVETLEAIAAQSFTITYKKYVKNILGFEGSFFDYRSGDGLGYSTIYVQDDSNAIRKIPLQFYKNTTGWFLDIKGIKEQLRATETLVAEAPSGLKQALFVDLKNIGSVQLIDNQELAEAEQPVTTNEVSANQLTDTSSQVAVTPVTVTQVNEPQVAVSQVASNTKEIAEPQSNLVQEKPVTQAPKSMADQIKIDVAVQQEEDIVNLLLPLMNKDVELATQAGKFKNGVYVGVHRKQIVLEVEVGGGQVEFLTEFHNMKSLRVLNSPNTKPQLVDFFNSSGS